MVSGKDLSAVAGPRECTQQLSYRMRLCSFYHSLHGDFYFTSGNSESGVSGTMWFWHPCCTGQCEQIYRVSSLLAPKRAFLTGGAALPSAWSRLARPKRMPWSTKSIASSACFLRTSTSWR